MAIKKYIVNFSTQREVEVDEKASDAYIITFAQSQLNEDLRWEIDVFNQFDSEIIREDD